MIDSLIPFEKTGSLLKSAEIVQRQDFLRMLKTFVFGTHMLKPVDKSKLRKSIEYKVYTPIPGGGWSCSLKSKYSKTYVTGLCAGYCHNGKQRAFENALNKLYEYELYAFESRKLFYHKLFEQIVYYDKRSKL